jgi:hypothetical protein
MKKSAILLVLSVLMFLPSCMTTNTNVKNYDDLDGQEYYYAKGKQNYLFWGLLPLGKPNIQVPENEPCQIRTTTTFVDGLVSDLTIGIFSMQSVRILTKRQQPLQVGDKVKFYAGSKDLKGTMESIQDAKKGVVRTEDGKLKKVKLMDVIKLK